MTGTADQDIDRAGNPFVGPRTFEESEADRFFGRDREARDLLALVARERLVLFYAQSGTGKSSLLNARLVPELRNHGFEVLPVGRVSGVGPPGIEAASIDNIFVYNLLLSLNQRLPEEARIDTSALTHTTLLAFLGGAAFDLPPADTPEDDATPADELAPTVLLIDQFEEIVTSNLERWHDRPGFFEQLSAVLDRLANLWVVLTLREDYVARLEPYAELLPNRLRARFYMERMGIAAALEAVKRPAETYGHAFAPGVAEKLVDNLRHVRVQFHDEPQLGQYVEPVQLQVVCYQLWEKLSGHEGRWHTDAGKQDQLITEADLPLGYIDQALTVFYEDAIRAVLDALDVRAASVSERGLRTWFSTKLITSAGTRGTLFRDETTGVTDGLSNTAVDLLARKFLLRSEPRAGGTWVELVHDRFVEPILEANRAWFDQNQNLVTPLAMAWQAAGEAPGRLLAADRLKEAQMLLAAHPDEFGDLERRFLAASQEAVRRAAARRRRLITLGAVALGLVVVFAALTAWALWSASEANRSQIAAQAAEATAEAQRQIAVTAQANAETQAGRATEREAEAVAAKANIERLTRGIRADQLTSNALKVVGEDPALALLLGAEGLRAQYDMSETVVAAAQSDIHELLSRTGGTPLMGHTGPVSALAFSPDGRWLATASDDNTARLWDTQNAQAEPAVLQGHADWVTAVAFSPDGRLLATASLDGTARLWDAQNLQADPTLLQGHTGAVSALAFSPDGHWLATASDDSTARLWNAQNAQAVPAVLQGHTGPVTALALSPDGRWLATASWDNTARLWDTQNPQAEPTVLQGHADSLTAVAFSPDGRWLATASADNTARLWDTQNPQAEPTVLQGHADSVNAVAFSPDSRWLATASADTTARLWDTQSSQAEPAVLQGHSGIVNAVVFSPDGRWLATASSDSTARLWDTQNPQAEPVALQGHTGPVRATAFSPDGRWLATASDDATARLWDKENPRADFVALRGHADLVNALAFSPPDGRWLATASWDTARLWDTEDPQAAPTVLPGHTSLITALAFSPDGRWLATASSDTTARLWDTHNPQTTPIIFQGHAGEVTSAAFSPDGRWLATGSYDTTARLWDTHNPRAGPTVLQGHTGDVTALAFSPDGRWLATASADSTTRLWDTRNAQAEPTVLQGQTGPVSLVAFSPDGRWLATASTEDTSPRLWDIQNAQAGPTVLQGHPGGVTSMAFSPDGRWLATASTGDTNARLWDIQNPQDEPFVLQGHTGWVRALAFGLDDRWLATASDDTTAQLWDTQNPQAESVVLKGHTGPVTALAFSPDGHWLATASSSEDNLVGLWTQRIGDLIDLACRSAGRNLTMQEWQRYRRGSIYRATCKQWPVHPSVAEFYTNNGRMRAQNGEREEAMAQFRAVMEIAAAQAAGTSMEITKTLPAAAWLALCRQGSLARAEVTVLPACDRAVALAPQHGPAHDSRGVARALNGDTQGAIADFEAAVRWAEENAVKPTFVGKRSAWIAALRDGRNPFDTATLSAAFPE